MHRKEFIKITASSMAALAAGVVPLRAANKTAGSAVRIRKSLKFGMVQEDLSVMDKFKLLVDLGFDGVELDSPADLDKKEVLEARDKTGLLIPGVVNALHWKKPLSHADPDVRAECVESVITSLKDCRDYGGNTVLVVAGKVDADTSYDEAWERTMMEIRKILPYAEQTGVKIAIENVWNNFLLSPLEAARYIDAFDHEMIGWYFDVGNVVRYGWPEQWIHILGERILKLDIKEYSRVKQKDEGVWKGFDVKLGDGDCNWPVVMKALSDIGYKGGWGSAEVPGGDRYRLREISERMDKIFGQ
jgi:hexulose-6-phosphate isomerase